jgi:redox-sensitive bicupin YhaK (pirin superfamily)
MGREPLPHLSLFQQAEVMSNVSAQDFDRESSDNKPDLIKPRAVKLTTRNGIDIKRLIPHRDIKTIGPWCFLDYYGPTSQKEAMNVAAHPHTGLQTVSWLFSGSIDHRDCLGTSQIISPGELNLMTAGRAIAHSELSIDRGLDLHGVQLWVVLPEAARHIDPEFKHHKDLPRYFSSQFEATIFMGSAFGQISPAQTYSPLVGMEITIKDYEVTLERNPLFEYGALLIEGRGERAEVGELIYYRPGDEALLIKADPGSRFILIGGEPFCEPFIIWWNFIGRSHEEIVSMRNEWAKGLGASDTYPNFVDDLGGEIPAPALPNLRLKPRNS